MKKKKRRGKRRMIAKVNRVKHYYEKYRKQEKKKYGREIREKNAKIGCWKEEKEKNDIEG